jgi:hypothetical protein
MRQCGGCGTRLSGNKFHGFVRGAKLVCGRSERPIGFDLKTEGKDSRRVLKTPECKA